MAPREDRLEWSAVGRPIPGEDESGDTCFVGRTRYGWLVVVGDGLGHGREAAAAARALLAALHEQTDAPLPRLLHHCHERLRDTRGSAVSFASIHSAAARLEWLGIGNVEGVLCRAGAAGPPEYITSRGGIVGYRLPELQPTSLPLCDGDTLVLATDGVREEFAGIVAAHLEVAGLAERIIARFGRTTDDALALVARWHAPAAGGTHG